jgi:hypothetical protein
MSTDKFVQTFEQIRMNFQQIFRKLFGGGKADVLLEDSQDVLEAGIEIVNNEAKNGLEIVGTGDMGIGNTTAASAITSVQLAGIRPELEQTTALGDGKDCVSCMADNGFNQIGDDGGWQEVARYVHLNPARAKLLSSQEPLREYPWSSWPEYLRAPGKRPVWLRVDRVLGKAGRAATATDPAPLSMFETVIG